MTPVYQSWYASAGMSDHRVSTKIEQKRRAAPCGDQQESHPSAGRRPPGRGDMHIRTCHCSRFRAAKLCAWWTIARADVGTLTHCLHALIDRHQWRGLYGFYCTRRRYDQRRCSGAAYVVGQVHDGHNVVLAEHIIDRFESAPRRRSVGTLWLHRVLGSHQQVQAEPDGRSKNSKFQVPR